MRECYEDKCPYHCQDEPGCYEDECMVKGRMDPITIKTCDGKYVTVSNMGHLKVYRHPEDEVLTDKEVWREDDLIGDKYVLSLVQKIEHLENVIETWKELRINMDTKLKEAKEENQKLIKCSGIGW